MAITAGNTERRRAAAAAKCEHVWRPYPSYRRFVRARHCKQCDVVEYRYVLNEDGRSSVRTFNKEV